MTEQLLIYFKIALATLVLWPRGYLLVYVIDRTKSFSFGLKFFLGWIFGMSAFTLDVFAANVFGGAELYPWIFLSSALGQIFGLEFFIFILERKIVLPRWRNFTDFLAKQSQALVSLSRWEAISLLVLVLSFVAVVGIDAYKGTIDTPFERRVETIFQERNLTSYSTIQLTTYPLNDTLFKVWIATMVGEFSYFFVGFADIFYYLVMIAVFYFMLPRRANRLLRLLSANALSAVLLLYFIARPLTSYADLLFSIFLFVAVISLFHFYYGHGRSYYYVSSMALAFGVWTQNDGLFLLFPIILVATIGLYLFKKARLFDLCLSWFFAVLTVTPWIVFIAVNGIVLRELNFRPFILVNILPLLFAATVALLSKIVSKTRHAQS